MCKHFQKYTPCDVASVTSVGWTAILPPCGVLRGCSRQVGGIRGPLLCTCVLTELRDDPLRSCSAQGHATPRVFDELGRRQSAAVVTGSKSLKHILLWPVKNGGSRFFPSPLTTCRNWGVPLGYCIAVPPSVAGLTSNLWCCVIENQLRSLSLLC